MHRFLRSVGFSRLSELDDEERLVQDVCAHSDYVKITNLDNSYSFGEYARLFGKDTGITVCGLFDREHHFHVQYYFPFYWGTCPDDLDSISVDQHLRSFSFAGACDDLRIGTTMIFYVANAAEYLESRLSGDPIFHRVYLTGLAESGTVLLPVASDHKPAEEDPERVEYRTNLFKAAQNGDEEAIENLSMEDYDLYTAISRRVKYEDIYTIVDSYFIPYGMECDLYNVMGEIEKVSSSVNPVTKEKLILLRIRTNDMPLEICINEKDLTGMPEEGRRFKGVIWLQGRIDTSSAEQAPGK